MTVARGASTEWLAGRRSEEAVGPSSTDGNVARLSGTCAEGQ